MTKAQTAAKLTETAVGYYLAYMAATTSGQHSPEKLRGLANARNAKIQTLAEAAQALGAKLPTLDKIYVLAMREWYRRSRMQTAV